VNFNHVRCDSIERILTIGGVIQLDENFNHVTCNLIWENFNHSDV
jgi:hypothetical protein